MPNTNLASSLEPKPSFLAFHIFKQAKQDKPGQANDPKNPPIHILKNILTSRTNKAINAKIICKMNRDLILRSTHI